MYLRILLFMLTGTALGACGPLDGQTIDVSKFDEFAFSRTIDIGRCFALGDLVSVRLDAQAGNRLLNYTTLIEAGDTQECLALTEDGACLVAGEPQTRVLVGAENSRLDRLFRHIVIANQPDELCAVGNVTLCSEDMYSWDGLAISGDFCEPVYVQNGFEIMLLLQDLRDGPPDETAAADPLDVVLATSNVEVLRVEPITASDQLLGKNGDFAVIRSQADLDGVLLQDGSQAIDFENEIGVAVVIIRGPCQEFAVGSALETFLSVEIHGTLQTAGECFLDFGSIDAYLIVIPRTPKGVRLLLNGSRLDEIRL